MHWLQFRGPNSSGIAPENADPPIHFSADSNLLWKTEILPGWSSPCIVNDKIFLTGFNDTDSLLYVLALNRENGEILWKDSIIPNGYYKTFRFFDQNKDGAFDKMEWDGMWDMLSSFMVEHNMMAVSIEGSGEKTLEDIKWKVNEDTPETPSPLIVNEHAFFITNGGISTMIHRDSGNVVLKERLGAPGAYLSSPILAGNRIYTCSFNGTVTVISADDYSVLAQNKLKEKIGASPVAVDDVLYVRTDKHMYAFR